MEFCFIACRINFDSLRRHMIFFWLACLLLINLTGVLAISTTTDVLSTPTSTLASSPIQLTTVPLSVPTSKSSTLSNSISASPTVTPFSNNEVVFLITNPLPWLLTTSEGKFALAGLIGGVLILIGSLTVCICYCRKGKGKNDQNVIESGTKKGRQKHLKGQKATKEIATSTFKVSPLLLNSSSVKKPLWDKSMGMGDIMLSTEVDVNVMNVGSANGGKSS